MLDSMFKDVSKNAWHVKLMKWTLGFEPHDFRWGCPYWWLSFMNVIIFIPFSILKLIYLGMVKLDAKIENNIRTNKKRKFTELLEQYKKDNTLLDKIVKRSDCAKFISWLWEYHDQNRGNWEAIRSTYYNNLYHKPIDKKYKKVVTNKEKINQIVKIFKPIGVVIIWVVVIAVVAFLGYELFRFISYLAHLPGKKWANFFRGLLIILVGGGILGLALAGILHLLSRNRTKQFFTAIGGISKNSFNFIITKPFGAFFKTIGFLIKSSCPPITWKD